MMAEGVVKARRARPPRHHYIDRMLMMMLAALLTASEETFLEAVSNRDVDTVRTMLAAQPSLASAKNEKGTSAVILALFALRKGEEKFPDRRRTPCCRRFSSANRPSTFTKPPPSAQRSSSPLQTALLTSQYATAKLLLDHGADALVRQARGVTPMHEASAGQRRRNQFGR